MTNVSPVALVHGAGCSIGHELAINLAAQQVRLVLYDVAERAEACRTTAASCGAEALPAALANADIVAEAVKLHGRLDFLFNCFVPGPQTPPAAIFAYPEHLLLRNLAAAEAMVACASAGAIVNQCYVGALFEGTPLAAPILMARGAITGLTREICCKFGKAGIRINTLQLGLTDLPETRGLITPKTLARKTPVGRWATPAEVANFMVFLALNNGYMTGQSICFDGGLTAGNTGA